MKHMKTKLSVVYLALLIAVSGTLFFGLKSKSQQEKLVQAELMQDEMSQKLMEYERLSQIDSLLLEGDYDSAIQSYHTSLDAQKENKMGIPLRIALAEKLLHDNDWQKSSQNNTENVVDTVAIQNMVSGDEIRKFDSINFTLEKTRVQLARIKKQLKNKSLGAYLKFKSKKGNQMHYVGQVKNGQANGFGIALLDTGSRYEGQWKNNQREGEGTFYWPDGEYYIGAYSNDKRSGFGTYYWPNGEKYAGEWKEDKRSGSGQFFGSDGDVVAGGEWNDDELIEVNKK